MKNCRCLIVLPLLMLTACTQWERPGAVESTRNAEYAECRSRGYDRFPRTWCGTWSSATKTNTFLARRIRKTVHRDTATTRSRRLKQCRPIAISPPETPPSKPVCTAKAGGRKPTIGRNGNVAAFAWGEMPLTHSTIVITSVQPQRNQRFRPDRR